MTERIGFDKNGNPSKQAFERQVREVLAGKKQIVVTRPKKESK